jgi:hypothetical protein
VAVLKVVVVLACGGSPLNLTRADAIRTAAGSGAVVEHTTSAEGVLHGEVTLEPWSIALLTPSA